MKKIGIVTTVYGNNFGEALQAYAMRKSVIRYAQNTDAEIVNFLWHPQSILVKPGFENYAEQLKKKNDLFDEFRRNEIGLVRKPVEKLSQENTFSYDGFVFGSDQIWNTNAWKVPEFFGNFVPMGKPKIAYAASIGLKKDSPLLETELFERYIDSFQSLSVRESEHCQFIRRFTDKDVSFVADPTLLLDVQNYTALFPESLPVMPDNKFIFYYQPHSADGAIVSLINRLTRKTGWDVVHTFADIPAPVFSTNSLSARFYGPREFLYYIWKSSIVITRSYHAVVFAILFKKPFYVYVDKKTGSRFESLLSEIGAGLEKRLIYDELEPSQVSYKIDWDAVGQKLDSFKEKSIDYLKRSLDWEVD